MNVGNIDIIVTPQTVELRMRHAVRGNPGAVLALSEVDSLIAVLQQAKASAKVAAVPGEPDYTGTRCEDCNEPQFNTPSGVTCVRGHGGSGPMLVDAVRFWHHPESGCAFSTEPDEPFPSDPLCHEVDEDEYHRLVALYANEAADDPFAVLDDPVEKDPFDIL